MAGSLGFSQDCYLSLPLILSNVFHPLSVNCHFQVVIFLTPPSVHQPHHSCTLSSSFPCTWILVIYLLLPSPAVSCLLPQLATFLPVCRLLQARICLTLFYSCSTRISYRVLHIQMKEKEGR